MLIPPNKLFFEIELTNLDQLKEFIAMDSGRILRSPYSTVELFWPIPILERGLVIVDCPGLNEHEVMTKAVNDYISKADAIIFLLNAMRLYSDVERKWLQKMYSFCHNRIFIVCNRMDERKKSTSLYKLYESLENHLRAIDANLVNSVHLKQKFIHYVSSKNAREYQITGKPGLEYVDEFNNFQNELVKYFQQSVFRSKLHGIDVSLMHELHLISMVIETELSKATHNNADTSELVRSIENRIQEIKNEQNYAKSFLHKLQYERNNILFINNISDLI